MTQLPLIYVTSHHCQGDQNGGWTQSLDSKEDLPPVSALTPIFDNHASGRKLALLLEDGLLYPMKVTLDRKAGKRELPQFLSWKLKRFLPYPIEQVALRFVPLQEPLSYLTFSLPNPWVSGLFDHLQKQNIHCGYVGGALCSLLESCPGLREKWVFCLYDDFYLLCLLDKTGAYLEFRNRRLPFTAGQDGVLDRETLLNSDLVPLLTKKRVPLVALDFSSQRQDAFGPLVEEMEKLSQGLQVFDGEGSFLQRYRRIWESEVKRR